MWDVASGRELTRLETGAGYRGTTDYFALNPDWTKLYVDYGKREARAIEKDGKRLLDWKVDGGIREWDLETGKLLRTLKHDPLRSLASMTMSPDGTKIVTQEYPGGVSASGLRVEASLWNAKSGQARPLPGLPVNSFVFAPDSRSLITTRGESGSDYAKFLQRLDADTGEPIWSVPVKDGNVWCFFSAFSPDGKLLCGDYRIFEDRQEHWKSWLKVWNAETGAEISALEAARDNVFFGATFSPDSQTIAATNWKGRTKKLTLWRPQEKQPAAKVLLAEAPEGFDCAPGAPVFSKDGKWAILATQSFPKDVRGSELDILDCPQCRIHVVHVASARIKETIIAPFGFCRSLSLSPDGRTLASSGLGRVLLWDVGDLLSEGPGK